MKTETSHIKTAIMLVSETGMASARLLLKEFPEAEIFTPRYESGCTHIESTGSFTVKNFNRVYLYRSLRHLRTFHRPLREGQVHRPCRNLRGQHR